MHRELTAAYRFAHEHGPVALIALVAIGFIAWLWMTTLSSMANTLHDHSRDSGWYQRQTCVNVAVLAGTSPALCDPPQGERR
jgi:hypothetical protein